MQVRSATPGDAEEIPQFIIRELRIVLQALIRAAGEAGFWKLVSRVFIENSASRKLIDSLGFREVGIYEKHAKLDGIWRDVIIVERLIESNLE